MKAKDYGNVAGVVQEEPGSIEGSISVAGVLADSVHSPPSMICVGSPANSPVDLGGFALTATQAVKLGAMISAAGLDAVRADTKRGDVSRSRATQSELQGYCRDLAPRLDLGLTAAHGQRLGFMLFVFDFGEKGELAYISNAQREDLHAVVEQLQGYLKLIDQRGPRGVG